MIEMYKKEIVYDKAVYVGTPNWDLSELTMMKLYCYNREVFLKIKYNPLYSDTDALVDSIQHGR